MIRKTAALLALALFLALPASAQDVPGFSNIGVKGGLSFANMRGGDGLDTGYDTGFTGGVYGQFNVLPFVSPRVEVLYTQQGASLDGFGGDASIDLDYIQVPVLAKVRLPIVDAIFPSLYVGPYVSFAVNQEVDFDNDGLTGGDFDNVDLDGIEDDGSDAFNSTDYGLVFGTDVDFEFVGKSVTLSGRYNLGLRSVIDDDSANFGNTFGDDDLYNSVFMVTLGFGI